MNSNSTAGKYWKKLGTSGFGRWLFSKMVCFNAPYFGSIKPKILKLEANLCVGVISQRRAVQNHLKTVHAIALCNLAELTAGLMTDVSVPTGMRWIPKQMTVNYLQKAYGLITATATPRQAFYESDEAYEALVDVAVKDKNDVLIFSSEIKMWVSKKMTKA